MWPLDSRLGSVFLGATSINLRFPEPIITTIAMAISSQLPVAVNEQLGAIKTSQGLVWGALNSNCEDLAST